MTESRHLASRPIGVAIVAPSGYAPDPAAVDVAVARLQARGCHVMPYCAATDRFERFGANDAARVAQLHAAARDPAVEIVLALRGGYGLSRILPMLDWQMLADSGKLFVGHSDFTAFQMALLSQAGGMSFAGPMICDDFARAVPSEFTVDHFWQCVTQPSVTITSEQQGGPTVQASGVLWGGNLAILTHLVGTPYFPAIDGGILYLEDINEHPFRVERMLMQLLHAGVLARQSAILLGDFSGYRLSDYDNGFSLDAALAHLRGRLPVPILTGLPFGHIVDKVTLPVGARANLTGDAAGWQLTVAGYPVVQST